MADFFPPKNRAFVLSIYHYGVYLGQFDTNTNTQFWDTENNKEPLWNYTIASCDFYTLIAYPGYPLHLNTNTQL